MNQDITNRILLALPTATDQQKAAALRALTATPEAERPSLPPDTPLLCTVKQATKLLNVSRSTLWRVMRAGALQKIALYPGGCQRLRRADIEALARGTPTRPSNRKNDRNQNPQKKD